MIGISPRIGTLFIFSLFALLINPPSTKTSSLLIITILVILLVLICGVNPGFCGFCKVSFFKLIFKRTDDPKLICGMTSSFNVTALYLVVLKGVTVEVLPVVAYEPSCVGTS